ncbi:MAG: Si-specific NAD(P)(+) transhydrogenase [Saccharospirillaceae bacterium]|nr:Si-specific NAD(P)(+) transhydrogenase [Pseudomonadales bacterium]NRB81414.1 Si-specific NAD(P)(+) transhydrogenase [Saccharospirillaceae bacterium]
MNNIKEIDFVVIGSGPAGQKAAIQAAKGGKTVALIEQDLLLGGACVHRGTIPSKTLRENAKRVNIMRENANLANFKLDEATEMTTLIDRLDEVLKAHDSFMAKQIKRNNIEHIHGRANFESKDELTGNHVIKVRFIQSEEQIIHAKQVVIATGSIPREPDDVPIDHEYIFDSDSILSMLYLPKSLTVLGGGVIASEYASVFQALGVEVTMIDKYPRPLGFLDHELTDRFVHAFEQMGGTWMGNTKLAKVFWDGQSSVVCETSDGELIKSEKLLCAAGRYANIKGLKIENIGLSLNERGHIPVNEDLVTPIDNVYAAGDVIGPPSLASTSMEQGRRVACNALNLEIGNMSYLIPTGIYGIPELSAVGLTEMQAKEQHTDVIIGHAHFEEVARGQISGIQDGMLKLICSADAQEILGVKIVGEGATELIHIGQMAMLGHFKVKDLVETIFNFPTLAEAYRVAALSALGQINKK